MATAKNEQIAEVTADEDGGVQPRSRRRTVDALLTFELQECLNHDLTSERAAGQGTQEGLVVYSPAAVPR